MQSAKMYFGVSAIVFGCIAIGHLTRAIQRWPITVGTWSAPVGLSWLAAVIGAALSAWAIALLRRRA